MFINLKKVFQLNSSHFKLLNLVRKNVEYIEIFYCNE